MWICDSVIVMCWIIFNISVGCDGDGLWYRVEMEAGS